jgi:cytochrome P450
VQVEGQEAFKALVERFPELHLDVSKDELEYQPSITFRSLKSLPVSWN